MLDAQSIPAQLDALTHKVDKRGVFGASPFFVGEEMFWTVLSK
jgi:2-hydroxychromene-2-carboxylate isomerase